MIRGVTTNPTMIREQSTVVNWDDFKALFSQIVKIVEPLPVSVPILSGISNEMLTQARELAVLGENVVVKIAAHSPEGGFGNLEVVHELSTIGVIVNVTAVLTAEQALLAILAGASYVSLFGGRLIEAGGEPAQHIRRLRAIIDHQRLGAAIIATSVRERHQALEWLDAGADFVTLRPTQMAELCYHEGTARIIGRFLESGTFLLRGHDT